MAADETEYDALGDPHEPQDDGPAGEGQESRGVLQESLRRVLLGGASALLTTEEGLRSLIAERRLPKEALSALLQQTDKTRKELGRLWGRELKQALSRVDAGKEIRRALNGLRFEINASVRIVDDRIQMDKADVRLADPDPAAAAADAAAVAATSGEGVPPVDPFPE